MAFGIKSSSAKYWSNAKDKNLADGWKTAQREGTRGSRKLRREGEENKQGADLTSIDLIGEDGLQEGLRVIREWGPSGVVRVVGELVGGQDLSPGLVSEGDLEGEVLQVLLDLLEEFLRHGPDSICGDPHTVDGELLLPSPDPAEVWPSRLSFFGVLGPGLQHHDPPECARVAAD